MKSRPEISATFDLIILPSNRKLVLLMQERLRHHKCCTCSCIQALLGDGGDARVTGPEVLIGGEDRFCQRQLVITHVEPSPRQQPTLPDFLPSKPRSPLTFIAASEGSRP